MASPTVTVRGVCFILAAIGAGLIVAVMLVFTVRFARLMGNYLESSTGLTSEGVITQAEVTPMPAHAQAEAVEDPAATAPAAAAEEHDDDAADLRPRY